MPHEQLMCVGYVPHQYVEHHYQYDSLDLGAESKKLATEIRRRFL